MEWSDLHLGILWLTRIISAWEHGPDRCVSSAYLVVLVADHLLFLRRERGSSARQIAILVLDQIVEGILSWLEGVGHGGQVLANETDANKTVVSHIPGV